jgi:pimeloyl-ACP methyl ester carboxylesterase
MIDATLVAIHGFGSSPATWNRLNAIWSADKELRGLLIDPFGYTSPRVPRRRPFSTRRIPDYDDIAQSFANRYEVHYRDAAAIAIVTHSQGGLILQRFLAWMLHEGRGQELARIRTIVMLACPNSGSEYLSSLRRVLGYDHSPQARSLETLDKQVADAQRTVLQRVVYATGVDDLHCRIPFHVYAGDSDPIVPAASAQAAFPRASVLPGDHFSILDPGAAGNTTAETVKHYLLTDLAAGQVSSSRGQVAAITYIPFTPPVEQVLDAASARAELDGRRFLTADLLLAVLDLPDSTVEKCLDRFSPGLADQVRLRLRNALESAAKSPDYPKWQPFNLNLRREVLRARELAAEGGDSEVNELHLLLGILDNERSRTRQELANLLTPEGLNRLRNIAARILAEPVTPGSKTEKSSW